MRYLNQLNLVQPLFILKIFLLLIKIMNDEILNEIVEIKLQV